MVEIIICDDKKEITMQLSSLIQDLIKTWPSPSIAKSFHSGERLIKYLNSATPNKRIILLDIEMGGMSGLDVAKYIRNNLNDYLTEIIFVTGKSGYERELFQVRPSGFIAKPIDIINLFEVLNRVYEQLGVNHTFFSYNQHGVSKSIRIDDIQYFESNGRKINIVSQNYTDWFYKKMKLLEKDLKAYPQFVCCHRSYIVNVKHVFRKNGANLLMTNGQKINISAKQIPLVEQTLLNLF